jgi:enterochelin esterase family protein
VNFKRTVECWIYTPPGYETSDKQYPVLYLMHGNPGDAGRWVKFAAANRTLDNLLAAGKMPEMIVVMPDAQAPQTTPVTTDSQLKDLQVFEKYLIEEIMPFAEGKYRIAASKTSRSIAGLSRGAQQTLHVGFTHPDLFTNMGAFSTALPRAFPDAYPDAATVNNQIRLLYYSCGIKDNTVPFSSFQQSEAMLTALGVQHETSITTQDHTWENFRRELAVFLMKLQ